MSKSPSGAPKVAVVSTDPLPMELPPGELEVVPALIAAGAIAETVSWHADIRELDAYDHVVIRTPWDYPMYPEAFVAFVGGLTKTSAQVHNPPHVLQWNTHKKYLLELAKSAPVLPTVLVKRGDVLDIDAIIASKRWEHGAVQKPAIGGGARETFVRQRGCAAHVATEDTLVQPFWPEIETRGELSLIFLGGAYSHVVQKVPKGGDFRVQSEHGGSVVALPAPPGDAFDAATQVLTAALQAIGGAPLTYARVDGVMTDAGFQLMELEVIEPELFLEWDAGASTRFAQAILASPSSTSRPSPR